MQYLGKGHSSMILNGKLVFCFFGVVRARATSKSVFEKGTIKSCLLKKERTKIRIHK